MENTGTEIKSKLIAKVALYGDMHLSSSNYGAHTDYAKESLEYFTKITEIAEEQEVTHLIGLGDLTYGRIKTLEYRLAVEQLLERQYKLTNGNRYELKGNHDRAGYGMTEYEYYVSSGLIKESCNLDLGNLHITMADYGKLAEITPNIKIGTDDNGIRQYNMMFVHDFVKFNSTRLPNWGNPIELDNYSKFYGIDVILAGHIHNRSKFYGDIMGDSGTVFRTSVSYLGCPCRTAYSPEGMQEKGYVAIIGVYEDGTITYDEEEFPLWSVEDAFNIEGKISEKAKKEMIEARKRRSDMLDVAIGLAEYQAGTQDTEMMIDSLSGVDEKYKQKAKELLKAGNG